MTRNRLVQCVALETCQHTIPTRCLRTDLNESGLCWAHDKAANNPERPHALETVTGHEWHRGVRTYKGAEL